MIEKPIVTETQSTYHRAAFSYTRIRRLVWLPVASLALVFMAARLTTAVLGERSQESRVRVELESGIASQKVLFANEILLGQEEALRSRLDFLRETVVQRFAGAKICLAITTPSGLEINNECISKGAALGGSQTVEVGSERVGVIEYRVTLQGFWERVLSKDLLTAFLVALATAAAVVRILGGRIEAKIVRPLVEEVEAKARDAAIARTTQALAHDVRKPFSMFKSIIQIVEATEDPALVRRVLKLTLPEVNQAIASVEGMIQDVMQIGSDAKMHTEDVAPETLIEASLGELFRVYPKAEVSFSYEFSHRHMVRADSLRLGRVFANILGNAVQAIQEKGNLWFRTTEHAGFVEFALGNGGSFIPPENLPQLFDAFFTSGKKGGTGLGLAISKKLIEAHGGSIRCLSEKTEKHPSGMVEFIFTLPVADLLSPSRNDALPSLSREIQAGLASVGIAAARRRNTCPDPRC